MVEVGFKPRQHGSRLRERSQIGFRGRDKLLVTVKREEKSNIFLGTESGWGWGQKLSDDWAYSAAWKGNQRQGISGLV